MLPKNQICQRCHKPTEYTKMSMFNMDTICPECIEAERKHPLYELAREKEREALLAGVRNFPGIGWPPDEKLISEMRQNQVLDIQHTIQTRYKIGEALFRGQTRKLGQKVNLQGEKLPGKWVYGGVFNGTGDFSIIYGGSNESELEKFAVYTDTLGQYTGLKDKSKNRIFEGDICRYQVDKIGYVYYHNGSFVVKEIACNVETLLSLCVLSDDFEVIGNVYDNPELVKTVSA